MNRFSIEMKQSFNFKFSIFICIMGIGTDQYLTKHKYHRTHTSREYVGNRM